MFCPYCGNENPDDAKFCEHCGEKLGVAEQTTPEPEPMPKEEPVADTISTEEIPKEEMPLRTEQPPSGGDFMPRDVPIDGVKWLKEAWEIFQADVAQLIIISLVFGAACFVLGLTIIGSFATPGIYAGYLIVMIGYLRNKEKLDIGKMFSCGWEYFVDMLLLAIVGGIIASIASIFLVIPGIMVIIAFGMSSFLIVDKKVKFGDAINAAFALISKQISGLFMFALILIAICIVPAILGMIPVLGWLIGIAFALVFSPVLVIAYYKGYQEIYGDG